MKLVFMGTAAFAVPSLYAALKAGHELAATFTQPDRPAGRGRKLRHSPVKEAAQELNLVLVQPDSLKTGDVRQYLSDFSPEIVVVVAYGEMVPKWLIDLPQHGVLNVHGSLLPSYRGAAPINWAIARGESTTGVCTMKIDEGVDTGPVFLCEKTDIGPNETAPELSSRLAAMGASLLLRTLDGIESGVLEPKPQIHEKATHAPQLEKKDGVVVWSETANSIHNKIRAFLPWPSVKVRFGDIYCKVLASRLLRESTNDQVREPGTIVVRDNSLAVFCGDGALIEIVTLQPENRKPVSGADFANGMHIETGAKFYSIRNEMKSS